MRVSLVTLGDPKRLSGGYLFHRRMAEGAHLHGATLSFVSFHEYHFPAPALTGRSVVSRLKEQSPDVVVLDSIAAAFTLPWLGRVGRPLAAMIHQPPGGIDHGYWRTVLQRRLDVATYRRCERVLVASATLAEDIAANGISQARIAVVPPGRDLGPLPSSRLDLRMDRQAALLCIGNWVKRKGIIDLLRAVALLPDDLATLHLVGDEDIDRIYGHAVMKMLEAEGLKTRVVAHGPLSREQVAEMYASADVFVLPSYREPYGTVYGEAMAAGLPVVGWAAGNLPHLASNGMEGFIVPTGNIEELALALEKLCRDPALRGRMARSAEERGKSLPTWQQSTDSFFSELRALVTAQTT
jgi:glycosyltransferase involved in cell wall biosynthesis